MNLDDERAKFARDKSDFQQTLKAKNKVCLIPQVFERRQFLSCLFCSVDTVEQRSLYQFLWTGFTRSTEVKYCPFRVFCHLGSAQ